MAPHEPWAPLPPTRLDHWLVAHRARISGVLGTVALLTVLVVAWLIVNGDGVPAPWWPEVAALVAQAGVGQVVLRRAALRCSHDAYRGGRPPGPPTDRPG